MKKKKKKSAKKNLIPLLLFFVIFIIKWLINDYNSNLVDLIFFITVFGVITYSYVIYKSKYKNLFKLYLLVVLITFVFPILHAVIFKIDPNNYTYNAEYLNYKTRTIETNLETYNDYKTLESLLINSNKKFLKSKIKNSLIDSVFLVNNMMFKVIYQENMERSVGRSHNGYEAKTLIIYAKSEPNKEIGSFNIINETVEIAIKNKLRKRSELLNLLKNPINSVQIKEMWIECSTGFLLSNIKPISFLTQILQLIQIFILFVLANMISGMISSSKSLIITKKNT